MIKQLIILIQLLGLFFYHLFFAGDITVTQNVPESIVQGEGAVVEITINKNDLPGFAKVQQILVDGFNVEPVETKGATFSYKDNTVKFIWMTLPPEQEFTISYKITPSENTLGDFSLGGKFSFISKSDRKNIEIPSVNFKVIPKNVEEEIVENTVVNNVEGVVEDNVAENNKVEETEINEGIIIEAKRTIENVEGGKYKVTLKVDKKDVEGFAKIEENIPEGFTAIEIDSKNGVFSFKDNTLKILWLSVPKENSYTISYHVEAMSTAQNNEYGINGVYSYIENDETKDFTIYESQFDLNIEQIVENKPVIVTPPKEVEEVLTTKVDEPKSTVVEENKMIASNLPLKEETAVKEVIKKPVVTKKEITSTPRPETKVNYKVQVGAGHKKVPNTYFASRFNLKDKVSTINHEGWIKYLVGSFNEYKSARDKRNVVRTNVKTAFVTAYNSGTRITVQEALMISNQKWYK